MHGSHARRWARLLAACLAALLVVAAPANAKTTKTTTKSKARAAAALPAEFFGINGSGVWQLPAPQRAAMFARFRAQGLSVLRMDVSWSGIEPDAPAADGTRTFRWEDLDRRVAELAAAGLRVYPLLAYSATWAAVSVGDPMSRPADPNLFAGYAAAVAARYGRNGSFWAGRPELPALPFEAYEVWNEPNAARFWREQTTAPEDYADLYVATRTALHGVDPQARVVAAGLVDRGAETFLRRMLRHRPDLAKQLDAIAYHPYLYAPRDMIRRIRSLRGTLTAGKAGNAPIELTEMGWSTTEVSETQRARWMADMTKRLAADPKLRVTRMIPYGALTEEANPGNWEHWLGLYNADGTPKASATAWAAAIAGVTTTQAQKAATPALAGVVKRVTRSGGRSPK